MKIIIGLGNPGSEYETTRHNVGFLAIDRLIDRWKADRPQKKFEAEISSASFQGEKVLLVKPQTFMNLSGRSAGPLVGFHKCAPTDVIVIHDDLDLAPMVLRLKTGGGTGGHNGLKSLDQCLGTQAYHRVRVGIGKPDGVTVRLATADYVLQDFRDDQLKELDTLLDRVAESCEKILSNGMTSAMNQFNKK